MWMKRREILMKSSSMATTATWEEKAFAEDANGSLGGGCVWPPRSYSCSFCKREFRSAQALGGHMNVHRRDRARLKHSLTLQNNSHEAPNCTTTTLSPSRVSGLSTQENPSDQNTTFVVSDPNNYNYTKNFLKIPSSSMSVSKPPRDQEESIISISDHLQNDHHDFVETNLSVGLKKPSDQYSCGEDLAAVSCKRIKIADVSTLLPNFFISSSSSSNDHHDSYRLHHQVFGSFRSGSKENNNNLDLELRLGDPPKVK
ncbi:hypothetical protein Dsin_003543 [Dipteronia sinensis]|uniref:C2H2-type domain-containing protein n=1 Tax=Dipteronia sinensis TaxID=43782 RepID=A0AAE0B893_9ROSI|nr:hypothetical protein Dsin_003543 [Dipteronia sinensis]